MASGNEGDISRYMGFRRLLAKGQVGMRSALSNYNGVAYLNIDTSSRLYYDTYIEKLNVDHGPHFYFSIVSPTCLKIETNNRILDWAS